MRTTSLLALGLSGLVLIAAPAFAQQITTSTVPPPDVPAPATAPDGQPASPDNTVAITNHPQGKAGPGIDGPNAVNPAPGAGQKPYVGDGQSAFYDVQQRIASVEERAKTELTGAKRKRAMAQLASIKSELATQKARHGELRDWDRENLNHRLDLLEAQAGLQRQVAIQDR